MNADRAYDLIVIGFGKAGKTLAGALAEKNYKVAVLEKDEKLYGGTCINVGCLPTKSLVHRSKVLDMIDKMDVGEINRDEYYKKAIAEKDRMTTLLRGKNYHKLADQDNIDVLLGEASFVDAHHVRIKYEDGAEEILHGKVIVINTGSESRRLSLPGFEDAEHIHDSRSILEVDRLPKHLGIIGAGFIGLEFSSYFRGFGAEVTILESGDRFLPMEDPEDANAVKDRLEQMGIRFVFNAKIQSAEAISGEDHHVRINYTQEDHGVEAAKTLEVSELLCAIGRIPAIQGLNLALAGVDTGERGEVKVDDRLRTSQDHIFAVGDVKGGPQFTFVSLDDFRIVLPQVLNLLENHQDTNNLHHDRQTRPIYPNTTFIDPPYSKIGLSEEEAKAKYAHVKVKKMPAAAVPKAQVVQETEGFLKVIIDEDTDRILGAVLFCHESHEMINLFTLAINEQISATRLNQLIYNHPVMSEALNELLS